MAQLHCHEAPVWSPCWNFCHSQGNVLQKCPSSLFMALIYLQYYYYVYLNVQNKTCKWYAYDNLFLEVMYGPIMK